MLDPLAQEAAMKLATFGGVALCAAAIMLGRVPPDARARGYALGAGGVLLMFGNALIAATPLVLLVDVAYLLLCVASVRDGFRAAPSRAAAPAPAVSVVPPPAEALVMPLGRETAPKGRPEWPPAAPSRAPASPAPAAKTVTAPRARR